uniref:Transmembrane protein n=1 Tax=Caulobacter phage BL57 TaxID=3348355 RepID=A0AB74ULK3_9VIRU
MTKTVESVLVGAFWYALAWVIGAVALAFGAAYLYDKPMPPPYLFYFIDHPALTFCVSLIVCPIVGGLVVLAFCAVIASA